MKKQLRGFTLISAIFLVVVISALGLFAVTISTTQQQTSVMDFQGSRAYQAAKAGIEWGIYRVTKDSACPTTSPTMPAGQLSGFTVTITCNVNAYTEGTDSFSVYQLTSTATTGTLGSANYVERQLQVAIKNP
jgi:MSHA biogenesis protein MshP